MAEGSCLLSVIDASCGIGDGVLEAENTSGGLELSEHAVKACLETSSLGRSEIVWNGEVFEFHESFADVVELILELEEVRRSVKA